MLAEITSDHTKLFFFSEKEPDRILKTYPVLAQQEVDGILYLFFMNMDADPWKVQAAAVEYNADGTLAAFNDQIHASTWHKLHALWQDYARSHHV